MKIIELSKPVVAIPYGSDWQQTKAVSPDATMTADGRFIIHYVGTDCPPHERTGYRILRAESSDGVTFSHSSEPVLQLASQDEKHYSPCLRQWKNEHLLFYGLGREGKYVIAVARSKDGQKFTEKSELAIDVGPTHEAAAHSPKLLEVGGQLVCYYTGSNVAQKTYSEKYPAYDFGDSFRLFRTASADARKFSAPEQVVIEDSSLVNLYGHAVTAYGDTTYLVFTGFDGSVNRLYLTSSQDGIHFQKPVVLAEPDEDAAELGLYSTSIVRLPNGTFRLYYGCRYFDNRWNILSRTFKIVV